jgi:hypothetical protein
MGMQYILTAEEHLALVDRAQLNMAIDAIAAMRRMVVPEGQCIHDAKGPSHCDFCLLSPYNRRPDAPTYEMSRLMCTKQRDYSK